MANRGILTPFRTMALMWPVRAWLGAAAALACLGLAPATAPGQAGNPAYDNALALAGKAYRYGFPLMEVLRVRAEETSVLAPNTAGDAPVNVFSNAQRFADATERTIVAPNVDTLYSIAQLDLGNGPIVIEHPDMGSRYFTFELLDPYTNVIGYVGARTTGSKAGRFAIAWTKKPGRHVDGVRTIRSPYRRVWVIGRTLVDGGKGDLKRARALMRRYALVPLSRLNNPPKPPKVRRGTKPKKATEPTGLAFLDALGQALADNPPPARDRPLLAQLAQVGIGPGKKPSQEGLSQEVLDGLRDGVDQAAAQLPTQARSMVLARAVQGGGWSFTPRDIGDYGTDYDGRAQIAVVGLGANTEAEAMYPTALTDNTGALLDGRKSYRLVFPPGQAPPNRAFWSLTMYDINGYLVPNSGDRYAIGSSHPPLVKRRDGSIVVVMSSHKPSERLVNWLPAPASLFRLTLRVYWPTRQALSGAWKPGPIQLSG
jgi:hypothetical protein